jgi:hypothetical protein
MTDAQRTYPPFHLEAAHVWHEPELVADHYTLTDAFLQAAALILSGRAPVVRIWASGPRNVPLVVDRDNFATLWGVWVEGERP